MGDSLGVALGDATAHGFCKALALLLEMLACSMACWRVRGGRWREGQRERDGGRDGLL